MKFRVDEKFGITKDNYGNDTFTMVIENDFGAELKIPYCKVLTNGSTGEKFIGFPSKWNSSQNKAYPHIYLNREAQDLANKALNKFLGNVGEQVETQTQQPTQETSNEKVEVDEIDFEQISF